MRKHLVEWGGEGVSAALAPHTALMRGTPGQWVGKDVTAPSTACSRLPAGQAWSV